MWALIAFSAITILIVAIFLMKIKIIIDFYHGNDNDSLKITFKALFGLIKYKLNVPVIKVDENSPSIVVKEKVETGPQEIEKQKQKRKVDAEDFLKSFQDVQMLLKHVEGYYKIARSFLSKVTVSKLKWSTVIGVGDAAYTGMITGAFWTVKGSLVGIASKLTKVKTNPQITIIPDFNRAVSQTSFECMIQFRIGHAIFAGIKLIKYWKGGKPRFKTKPLSMLSGNKTKSV